MTQGSLVLKLCQRQPHLDEDAAMANPNGNDQNFTFGESKKKNHPGS